MAETQGSGVDHCWSCGKGEVSPEHEITVLLEPKGEPAEGSADKEMRGIPIPQCSSCGGAYQEQYFRRANTALRGCWAPPLATALVIAVAITALAPGAQGKTIADLPGMFAGAFFLSLVLTAIGFPVFMFVSNWIRGPRKPKSHLDRVPTDQRFAEHAEVRQALSEGWELYNVCPSKVIEEADPASSDPPSP